MTQQKNHRYKHSEGKLWIEARVKSPQQLFDARDPAPFRERDLDDDFVEYVVASARESSISHPLKIVIYIEETESKHLSRDSIKQAIHEYFRYQIDIQRIELRNFLRRAQIFLAIGFTILVTCLSLAQRIEVPLLPGFFGIAREGIVIFGWVSIWKPIELILFDWYPLYEKLRFYKKLATTEIDIQFNAIDRVEAS